MGSLHMRNRSYWVETSPEPQFPQLAGDLRTEVAVLGGGIAGLTTALLLAEAGHQVTVLEAGRIVSGATGYTTAKVTALQSLVYSELGKRDAERAAVYAEANAAAVEQVAHIIERLAIDCEFQRSTNYTYTTDPEMVGDIEHEAEEAKRFGLPAFTTSGDIGLPFPVAAAVGLADQARFHPRLYCLGVAEALSALGCTILEHTRATGVDDGEPCTVETTAGTVTADHVVIATHQPFPFDGKYFARGSMRASYAMAVRVPGPVPGDMYISAESPTRSVRPASSEDPNLLIVGGESHKVGQHDDTEPEAHYEALEQWSRENFGDISVEHRWFATDFETIDGFPYIGQMTSRTPHVFVATGFRKWGMTNGTVAAMILRDRIGGRDNPWADALEPSRLGLGATLKAMSENLNVARELVAGKAHALVEGSIDDLEPGQGCIGKLDGKRVAAYRDEHGVMHAVSARCTHMGCTVNWNAAERTWDCPCHGSRFEVDGRVIEGPATQDLESVLHQSAT